MGLEMRWYAAALVTAAIAISYFDRQTLPVAISAIQHNIPIPLLAALSGRMTSHDYTVDFLLRLMSKDLQYAHAAASEAGVALTTAANARALLEQAVVEGHGEQDMSAVIEPLRDRQFHERQVDEEDRSVCTRSHGGTMRCPRSPRPRTSTPRSRSMPGFSI
jgi:hypothetical protein